MSRPLDTPLTVLKFGSSVLRSDTDLPAAVSEVYRWVRRGHRVVAVVSAQGDTTDALLARANALDPTPSREGQRALAALLATGEEESSALFTLALERAGLTAARLDARGAGLRCAGDALDASPTELDVRAFDAAFERAPVVVLPGFVGQLADGGAALLGRGGSDLTALLVAHELLATRVRLVKDVDGLYESDPNATAEASRPRRFARIAWADAEQLGGGVVQPKAVRFAAERGLGFEVTALGSTAGTFVGDLAGVSVPPPRPSRPLRVALAGLGTVGGGVLERLVADPERFEVVGALVRDASRTQGRALDPRLGADFLVSSPETLFAREPDAFVELVGGVEPAGEWCERALEAGVHVVTANKALLAESGRALAGLARARGLRLGTSAAVGGAVPMLEAARRLGRCESPTGFEGVLNGTTNHVLDAVAAGATFAEAVADAQVQGFAEADPTLDLDGTDAAQKLALLAGELFPGLPEPTWLERRGIDALDTDALEPGEVAAARAEGHVVRLVATCHLSERGPVASVRPVALPPAHPLADVRGAGSALRIFLVGHAPVLLRGRGAGRWPTTEAVLADLFELCRRHERDAVAPVTAPSAGGAR